MNTVYHEMDVGIQNRSPRRRVSTQNRSPVGMHE